MSADGSIFLSFPSFTNRLAQRRNILRCVKDKGEAGAEACPSISTRPAPRVTLSAAKRPGHAPRIPAGTLRGGRPAPRVTLSAAKNPDRDASLRSG